MAQKVRHSLGVGTVGEGFGREQVPDGVHAHGRIKASASLGTVEGRFHALDALSLVLDQVVRLRLGVLGFQALLELVRDGNDPVARPRFGAAHADRVAVPVNVLPHQAEQLARTGTCAQLPHDVEGPLQVRRRDLVELAEVLKPEVIQVPRLFRLLHLGPPRFHGILVDVLHPHAEVEDDVQVIHVAVLGRHGVLGVQSVDRKEIFGLQLGDRLAVEDRVPVVVDLGGDETEVVEGTALGLLLRDIFLGEVGEGHLVTMDGPLLYLALFDVEVAELGGLLAFLAFAEIFLNGAFPARDPVLTIPDARLLYLPDTHTVTGE